MEIKNYTNAINAYRLTAGDFKKPVSDVKKSKNVDKAEFSSFKATVETVKAAAAKAADASASPERIAALKTAVSEGKYDVSSEKIINTIIGG